MGKHDDARLYAIEFNDGTVKVGWTWTWWERRREYDRVVKRANVELDGRLTEFIEIERDASVRVSRLRVQDAERHLIAFCLLAGGESVGNEWFRGVRFTDVAQAMWDVDRLIAEGERMYSRPVKACGVTKGVPLDGRNALVVWHEGPEDTKRLISM